MLCTETATDGEHYVAHNKSYEQILVEKNDALLGRTFTVKIIKVDKFFMVGEVIGEHPGQPAQAAAKVSYC